MQKIGLEAILEMSKFNRGEKEYTQGLDRMGDRTSRAAKIMGGLGNMLGGLAKAGIGAAVGGFGVLTAAIASSVKEAAAAQQVEAQLDAVLQSTGGTAGMTKDEILALAEALSTVTPFEDEVIASAETMLLQFKAIGEDVFPQATEMALDLAQRLGIDATSAAKLLGKALEEPGEGLLRLKQAGVAFTDAQEEMIKKMVEAGDTAGAQKFIMDELEKSVGGAARAAGETFAGKLDILQNKIGNVKETIGTAFLPVLSTMVDKFSQFVTDNGPAIEAFFQNIATFITDASTALTTGDWSNLGPLGEVLSPFVESAKELAAGNIKDAWLNFSAGIGQFVEKIGLLDPTKAQALSLTVYEVGKSAGTAAAGFGAFVKELAVTTWQTALDWFNENGPALRENFATIATEAGTLGANLAGLFSTVTEDGPTANELMSAMAETGLTEMATAVELLADGLEQVNTGWAGLTRTTEESKPAWEGWNVILNGIATGLEGVTNPFTRAKQEAEGWNDISKELIKWSDKVVSAFETNLPKAAKAVVSFADTIVRWFEDLPRRCEAAITDITEVGKAIVEGIKKGIEDAWEGFMSWVLGLVGDIIGSILASIGGGSPAKAFMPIGESIAQGIGAGWEKAMAGIGLADFGFSGMAQGMVAGWEKAVASIGSAGLGFSGMALSPAAVSNTTTSQTFGGDTFVFNVSSPQAWGMAQRWVEARHRERLNVRM